MWRKAEDLKYLKQLLKIRTKLQDFILYDRVIGTVSYWHKERRDQWNKTESQK